MHIIFYTVVTGFIIEMREYAVKIRVKNEIPGSGCMRGFLRCHKKEIYFGIFSKQAAERCTI